MLALPMSLLFGWTRLMLPLMHFVVSLQSSVCKLCRKRNHKDIIIYVHPFIHVQVCLLLCVGPYPQGPSDRARHGLKPLIFWFVCSKFGTNSADKRECSYSPHHCWYQRIDEHYWQSKLVSISTSGSCISWRHDVLHSYYLLVLCSQLWSAIFRHLSWQESKRDNNFLMWIDGGWLQDMQARAGSMYVDPLLEKRKAETEQKKLCLV